MAAARMKNHLADALSPYLEQHVLNPVDWYPWGQEALARARELDRPIFLSIGYSTCHWCHVMAHESFEDRGIAGLLNEHFVPIKVDREERPDLDAIYMDAVQAISGHGGWPLSAFLTPDLRPFFGGTYFPPEDREGQPGFRTVLESIAAGWRERRAELEEYAEELLAKLRAGYRLEERPGAPAPAMLGRAYRALVNRFDRECGGFGRAPKFPPTMALRFLMRYHEQSGEGLAREMVARTLAAMAQGGLRDHLGGGFHRYATDRAWRVPHFEKMLYDNALLAACYLEAHRALGGDGYGAVAVETLDYLLEEMVVEGGFASAQDADTEGVEGLYYTWTVDEIEAALDPVEARAVMLRYGVTTEGNVEGRSVLAETATVEEVAAEMRLATPAAAALLERARRRLLDARRQRTRPFRDDKVLASWNGLTIGALAQGSRLLHDERYLAAAKRAATLVVTALEPGGELHHAWRAGRVAVPALLEDFAYVAAGLLDLHEADPQGGWAEHALGIVGQADPLWDGERGGYLDFAPAPDRLLTLKTAADTALPSPNAVMAQNLVRLGRLTGDQTLRERAYQLLAAFHSAIEASPSGHAEMMVAVDQYHREGVSG